MARTWASRLLLVERGEWTALLGAGATCFLLMAGYYALKPARDALVTEGDLSRLSWLIAATMGAMLVVQPLYAMLAARVSGRKLVVLVYQALAVSCVGFAWLMRAVDGAPAWWVGAGLFVWTGVFNVLAVSAFWSFMGEVFDARRGARLFGLVSVGGTLGSIAGAGLAGALAGGAWSMVAGAAALQLAAIGAAMQGRCPAERGVEGVVRGGDSGSVGEGEEAIPISGQAGELDQPTEGRLGAISRIARSRYLRAISAYVLLFTMTSTIVYLTQARVVQDAGGDRASRARIFARIDLLANVLTVVLQVFVSGRVVSRLGPGRTLAATPLVTGIGLALVLAWPSVAVLAAVQAARRGVHFALDRPARELLFHGLPSVDRFGTKSFIDTFVYRLGDVVAAGCLGMAAWMRGWMLVAGIGLCVLWFGLALWLHRARAIEFGHDGEARPTP